LMDADIRASFGQQKTRPGENPLAGHTRPRPFSDLFNVAASRPAQMTTG
jgi:hypothetical protein